MRSITLSFVVATVLSGSSLAAQPLPTGDPKALGFSPERLQRLDASMRRFVDDGRHAGLIWLVARRGKIVDFNAYGLRDVESKRPMEKDTILRIYSMSKIVTSVAALILLEEGRYSLGDPVSRFLPEFGTMQVMTGGTAEAPLLTTARGPITIKHLLTHTSGLIYGRENGDALQKIYWRRRSSQAASLEEFTKGLAGLPLHHQPGEAWAYGTSTDVLGRLVEVVSGRSLGQFMAERIFEPLGMHDTGFEVPAAKMARLATIYKSGERGVLVVAEPIGAASPEAGREPAFGGEGLFSTAADYARFAQMLLEGGTLDGRRILGRKTVELMTTNHLTHLPGGHHEFSRAMGFGLGVQVLIDLGQGGVPGSLGEFGWSGAATTFAQIDPKEQMVTLAFAQHFPFNAHKVFDWFVTGAYQALVD